MVLRRRGFWGRLKEHLFRYEPARTQTPDYGICPGGHDPRVGHGLLFWRGESFARHETFLLYFDDTVNGLDPGSLVRFRGVPIGTVATVRLNFNRDEGIRRVPVVIQLNADRLQNQLGVLEDLTNPAVLADQIHRGLRAELHSESYVTGSMFVELDYHPKAPAPGPTFATDLPVIPTIQSASIARIQKTQDIIAELPGMDFRARVAAAAASLESLRMKVSVIPFAEFHQKIVDGLAPITQINPDSVSQKMDTFLGKLDQFHDEIAQANSQFSSAGQTFVENNQQDRQLLKDTDSALAAVRDDLRPAAPWLAHVTHNLQEFSADLVRLTGKTNDTEQTPGILSKPTK